MKSQILNRSRMRGLSLVETLVAVTISLILMGGAITLFVNNRVTYQTTDNLSRLQENARFAVDFLVRDLRLSGYLGCNNSPTSLTNLMGGAFDTTSLVEGLDDDTSGIWEPSGAAGPGTRIGGTDAVTIRHISVTDRTVLDSTETTIEVPSADGLDPDEAVAVSDCKGTTIFQLTDVDYDTQVLTHAGGIRELDTDGDPTNPRNPKVTSMLVVRYFIAPGANGGPSLFREIVGGAPAELVDGVENMQLLYGVDNTGDKVPDAYLQAGDASLDDAGEWDSVVSVRVALLMRTAEEYGQDVNTSTYQLNDVTIPAANDRFKRRVFNTTVLLRNRLT